MLLVFNKGDQIIISSLQRCAKNSKLNIDMEKYPTAKLIRVAHGQRQNQLSAQNVKLNMEGFLNCHLFKNGGRDTKPTYIFMVIIPLLVIELKATLNGNPRNDFFLETEI